MITPNGASARFDVPSDRCVARRREVPINQALEVHDGPGKCRRDGRDLVQVTVSEFWTCGDSPDKKLIEPGKCADGAARKINYELRAHGDHNPRHGGQFFMATDAWHHVEGTYPENGLVRVFFYDNFTKPLALKGTAISFFAAGGGGAGLTRRTRKSPLLRWRSARTARRWKRRFPRETRPCRCVQR